MIARVAGGLLLGFVCLLSTPAASAECSPEDPDLDGDGYCASEDCNDLNPSINPGAPEDCFDTRDNDCDGLVDEEDPSCSGCPDADGDGYTDAACGGTDCNDQSANIHPGAVENCLDTRDNDCDGLADAEDPDCAGVGCTEEDPDADGDGFCASNDCNDENPFIHPGAPEQCESGQDEDCDGLVDQADQDCPGVGCTEEDPDADGDGFCASNDCNDENPSVNPGAAEQCEGGLDEDCDGLADRADSDCSGCTEEDPDGDGDGSCDSHDCDDADPAIHPGAIEQCENGIDEDCDGLIDEQDPDCSGSECPGEEQGIAHYWVYFRDKGITTDQELSQALALEAASLPERTRVRRAARRAEPGLVDASDLAVHEPYVDAVVQTGARLRHRSRWLNAASVAATAEQADAIRALPFVERVETVLGGVRVGPALPAPDTGEMSTSTAHGLSQEQLDLIGVTHLHEAGFTGAGVVIGVLDTGFVTTHDVFNHPGHPLRVLAKWDFVRDDPNPGIEPGDDPRQHEHGTIILGTMAGYLPGTYLGGAYDAEFILAKTENVACEIPIEEDAYVAGLEFAEWYGADVVTSSLGYIQWYTQDDLDGRTAVTTKAVNFASFHGVHCVTAAGNGGHDFDPSTSALLAPGDAFRVLTVGAIEITGELAAFSSDGPTADGRVKPEVLAVGRAAWSVLPNDDAGYGQFAGTSLSTPQVAAAVACLVQSHPEWTVDEMRTHLMASGSVYRTTGTFDPNYIEGYGVIDASFAAGGDCDADGVRDRLEIQSGAEADCDGNFVPDACDIRFGTWPDRNGDGVPDRCRKHPGRPRPPKKTSRAPLGGGETSSSSLAPSLQRR